jgi:chromosome segregation ATPase
MTGMVSSASNAQVERRLRRVSEQLRSLRDDLRVTEEHLAQLSDEEEDARIRALVSETPLAEKEHRKASRHAERLRRSRDKSIAKIAALEREQDDLLDRLTASS